MALAHKNLGTALCESGRIAESFASFRRHAELAYGTPESSARGSDPAPPHKAQHDREQQDYLNGGNALADHASAPAMFHLEEGGRVTGHAVNPDASLGDIATRWQSSRCLASNCGSGLIRQPSGLPSIADILLCRREPAARANCRPQRGCEPEL
jgi:hypothetical protein